MEAEPKKEKNLKVVTLVQCQASVSYLMVGTGWRLGTPQVALQGVDGQNL